jgi:hypothetical protein
VDELNTVVSDERSQFESERRADGKLDADDAGARERAAKMTELTEELLANAERLYLLARGREEEIARSYHWSGVSAILQQGGPMEEKTKWLI